MKSIFIFLFFIIINCSATAQNNILMYGGGDAQVTTELNDYKNIISGKPITGTIMVTHDSTNAIDLHSFRLGEKPLQVELITSARMSAYSNLEITTYKFHIEGLNKGLHTLPPINVKIGGKLYQAPPLIIEVEP